jgi:hypothetical protein
MSKPMMKAYHNDPAIKAKYLRRVRAHRKADEIVKGHYWENGKGCAVGCTIHGSDRALYETELGIPIKLASLEDGIFENLPNGHALKWPEQFLSAIKPGADLNQVTDKFLHWLLIDPDDGVIRFAKTAKVKKAIQRVADLYAKNLCGEIVTLQDWSLARTAAYAAAAAAYAAYAAAADAAAYAAYAAAYAAAAYAAAYAAAADAAAAAYAADAAAYAAYAAYAAAYAADAAAYAAYAAAADAAAARNKSRIRQAEKLLELLKAA